MCGILGFSSRKIDQSMLMKLIETIEHRGPDDQNSFFDQEKSIGLGHTRLSIIDLSADANQPFISSNERYILVYNGEIYNYRQLRDSLKNSGVKLRTTSDTEVLLEGYVLWGTNYLSQLNGMFAFAIYDRQNEEFFLCRDRMGVKPLYYISEEEGGFVFASEIKVLKRISGIKLTINPLAVEAFLRLGYIPGPYTIYNEVKKFPQGSYGVYSNGNLKTRKFWSISPIEDRQKITNEEKASEILGRVLEEAVTSHMVSDVPVGTFLSGGTDSSLVTALASRDNNLKTFSIGFKESKFDESSYAEQVARHLKTDHRSYVLHEEEAMDHIQSFLDIYDEPFADSSFLPTLMVSKLARKEVKVVMSGDGGDELFFGYGMYKWAEKLDSPILRKTHNIVSSILGMGNSRAKRVGQLLKHRRGDDLIAHIFSQEQYFFSEREVENLLQGDTYPRWDYNSSSDPILSPMERQSIFDLRYYLPDDLLVKVDRASMFHSLEVRVPLLDHRLVECALSIDPRLRTKNGILKYLLKKELKRYLPAPMVDRPKWGFSIPLSEWLRGGLSYMINDHLNWEDLNDLAIVNPSEVKSLIQRFENGDKYLFNRIWSLVVLHMFMKNENSRIPA